MYLGFTCWFNLDNRWKCLFRHLRVVPPRNLCGKPHTRIGSHRARWNPTPGNEHHNHLPVGRPNLIDDAVPALLLRLWLQAKRDPGRETKVLTLPIQEILG